MLHIDENDHELRAFLNEMEDKKLHGLKPESEPQRLKRQIVMHERQFQISMDIYTARARAGLTQQELADKIGTTRSVISNLEKHNPNPRLMTLLLVAEAFNLTIRLTKRDTHK